MKSKKDKAIEAIDEVFSDTSVPPSETLEQLEEILTEIEFKIGALREQLDHE